MDYEAIGQGLLAFSAGAFWGDYLYRNLSPIYRSYRQRKASKNVAALIEKMKREAEISIKAALKQHQDVSKKKPDPNREVHKFQWRHEGKMNEVNIIIDPSLDKAFSGSLEDFEGMVAKGEAGTLEDLLNKVGDSPKELADTTDFVFSAKSVKQMQEAGLTPDELVAKMLKASGRMA